LNSYSQCAKTLIHHQKHQTIIATQAANLEFTIKMPNLTFWGWGLTIRTPSEDVWAAKYIHRQWRMNPDEIIREEFELMRERYLEVFWDEMVRHWIEAFSHFLNLAPSSILFSWMSLFHPSFAHSFISIYAGYFDSNIRY
jgi:hypothetical protein